MGKNTTQNPCSSFSCCGYVHRRWTDHSARRHFTIWTAGLHCNLRIVARQRTNHVSDILAFESIETGGKIFICSRDAAARQTAMTKLSTYVFAWMKFCSDSWNCKTGNLKRDNSCCFGGGLSWCLRRPRSLFVFFSGAKDKKSGLEVLALKQSLVEYGTMIRWCHSAAQLCDVVTKDSDAARAPCELFVRRGVRWEIDRRSQV